MVQAEKRIPPSVHRKWSCLGRLGAGVASLEGEVQKVLYHEADFHRTLTHV